MTKELKERVREVRKIVNDLCGDNRQYKEKWLLLHELINDFVDVHSANLRLIAESQKLRERVAELEKRDSSTLDSYDEILKERNDACAREWDLRFQLAARKEADADVLTAVLALDTKQPLLAKLQDRLLSTSWLKAGKSSDSQDWRAQVISQASFPVWVDGATAAAIHRAIEGVLEERGLIKREKP